MMSVHKLPSNSHKNKVVKQKKVVKGRVRKKKKGFVKQIADTFIGEEVDDVGEYILHDVVIPAIKNTLSDAIQSGITMLLFGDKGYNRGKSHNGIGKPNLSYTNFAKPNKNQYRNFNNRGRNMDDIVLDSHAEALDVLNSMVDIIDEYGQVSVADLNDLLGVSGKYTDNDYGWENLNSARVSRIRDGYLLNIPKPIYLN